MAVLHSPAALMDKVLVESRLPAYINMDEATLVFVRTNTAENIPVVLSFLEQDTQSVPVPPVEVTLSGNSLRCEVPVDISSWADGDYKVFIAEKGCSDAPLVRGIRKQTSIAPQAPSGPFSVDGSKMFFVDDWYFESVSGLERTLHPAELIPVEPWNADPACKAPRNSIQEFWVDINGDYNVKILPGKASRKMGEPYWVKSPDLKDWEFVPAPGEKHQDCSLVDLRQSSGSSSTNYRRYDPARDGKVDLSQVRVRWSGTKRDVKWGDIPVPYRSRTAVWEKPNGEVLVLGDPITIDKSVFEDDEIGTWANSNDNFGDVRLSPDGKTLSCYQARLIPRHDPFRVHYDNNLSDRILVTWSTTNGVNWTPSFFDAPTLDDPWATQHYGVDMWSEEEDRLEFAYHKIFDVQYQKVYTELAYSRNGVVWNRIKGGKPFLDNGAPGDFNYGYSITTGNRTRMSWDGYYYEPMQCINVLHFMFMASYSQDDRSFITPEYFAQRFDGRMVGEYGVENSPIMNWHSSWEEICEVTKTQMFTPTFMRYRADGWIGASPAKRRAEIVTKVLHAAGGLRINAATPPDGFISVEVLDEYGNDLPEYCRRNAAVFKGDRVDAELSWSNGAVRALPSEAFKLRIKLEKSEIFTLRF
jgi:hypothetical protein